MSERGTGVFDFEFSSDTLMRGYWKGEAQDEDVDVLREMGDRHRARCPEGPRFALVDASEAKGFSRSARDKLRLLGKDAHWDALAFVGMPFRVRVAMNLITRALTLLEISPAAVRFVETEADAMAWLESLTPRG